jgi:hypothetical protein
MATTAITPTPLVIDTASADIVDGDGTVATTPADGWVIAAPVGPDVDVILKFLADASGDTVTVVAGDRPPSQRSGLGNLSITLAANDVKYVMVEKSRFLQDDGTILATCTDAGTTCYAFTIPKVQ